MLKVPKQINLSPWKLAQKIHPGFHQMMQNIQYPATQHWTKGYRPHTEQIEMVEAIMKNVLWLWTNGSVYFDTLCFLLKKPGIRQIIREGNRWANGRIAYAENQDEKTPFRLCHLDEGCQIEHIMKWNSPLVCWLSGWHLECSAMSTKYLGKEFDIYMEVATTSSFHHENEIAQNVGLVVVSLLNIGCIPTCSSSMAKKCPRAMATPSHPQNCLPAIVFHITKLIRPWQWNFSCCNATTGLHWISPMKLCKPPKRI